MNYIYKLLDQVYTVYNKESKSDRYDITAPNSLGHPTYYNIIRNDSPNGKHSYSIRASSKEDKYLITISKSHTFVSLKRKHSKPLEEPEQEITWITDLLEDKVPYMAYF